MSKYTIYRRPKTCLLWCYNKETYVFKTSRISFLNIHFRCRLTYVKLMYSISYDILSCIHCCGVNSCLDGFDLMTLPWVCWIGRHCIVRAAFTHCSYGSTRYLLVETAHSHLRNKGKLHLSKINVSPKKDSKAIYCGVVAQCYYTIYQLIP